MEIKIRLMKNLIQIEANKKWNVEYDLFTTLELTSVDNIDDIIVIENKEIKSKNGDKILLFTDSFVQNSTYVIDVFDKWLGELSDADWDLIRNNNIKFYICTNFESKLKLLNREQEYKDFFNKYSKSQTEHAIKVSYERNNLPPTLYYFNNDNTVSKAGMLSESYMALLTTSDFHDIFHCMFK